MKLSLKGKLALDASALIELIYCDSLGRKLKGVLESDGVDAWATEVAIAELRYVLCRRLGWRESSERVGKLLASGYVRVGETVGLIDEASRTKCSRAISLPDCFTLALAHKIGGDAVFARREQDLATEMQRKPFDVHVVFLEDED